MIRSQLIDLNENIFRREEILYLACNEERAFSLPKNMKNMNNGFIETTVMLKFSNKQYFPLAPFASFIGSLTMLL